MNKTERDELRRLIRARFKVLRSDVDQRKAELLVELDKQVATAFAAEEKRWRDAHFAVQQAIDEANRKVNDIYRDLYGADLWGIREDKELVHVRGVASPISHKRAEMRQRGVREIEAKVKSALLELERREVDLLADLATSALESAEAVSFMKKIPTVSELVPAYRLREIQGEP